MKYDLAKANRLGDRSSNQDRFAAVERPRSLLLVLADGMGGYDGGLLAANTFVLRVTEAFSAAPSTLPDPILFLREAFTQAHHSVVDAGARHTPPINPRTTGVACVIQNGIAYWAHVGDSRCYVLRGGNVATRTRDHSVVEDLLAQGKITEKRAKTHAQRNQVTRCIGGNASRTPETTVGEPFTLEPGDVVLLCSDGLWGSVDDDVLAVHFGEKRNLALQADQIAQQAERNSYPKSDNVSLIALRWHSADGDRAHESAPVAEPKGDAAIDAAIDEINAALARADEGIKKIS